MSRVIILTASYPYGTGEQFLEAEMPHWGARVDEHEIVVVPLEASGVGRPLPLGIDVDLTLARSWTRPKQIASLLRAFGSKVLWRELAIAWSAKGGRPLALLDAVEVVAQAQLISRVIRTMAQTAPIDLVYSYWFGPTAMGAVLARGGNPRRVISRAHGSDVYEGARRSGYLALRRMTACEWDAVYAVSSHAQLYLQETFGLDKQVAKLSRLGVDIPLTPGQANSGDSMRLISVGNCNANKRLDRIILGLSIVAARRPDIAWEWIHLGDGPLRVELQFHARERLSRLSNVKFRFDGRVANEDVLSFLHTQPLDLIVNTSSSEGVPVSLMEAQAVGLPGIAPAVGAIHEIIDDSVGRLLSAPLEVNDLAKALEEGISFAKDPTVRLAARVQSKARYSAKINYEAFVTEVLSEL